MPDAIASVYEDNIVLGSKKSAVSSGRGLHQLEGSSDGDNLTSGESSNESNVKKRE